MAQIKKASSQSSLRKLQSLDSDFKNLEERLGHAARIAGLPGRSETVSKSSLVNGGHSRAEWVLRWVLEKLRSKDEAIGPCARLLPPTWNLLTQLVNYIPASNAARALNNGEILRSMQKALEERASLESEDPRFQPENGRFSVGEDVALPVGTTEKTENPRKRKRNGGSVLSERPNSSSTLAHFYSAIWNFVDAIIRRTQTGGVETNEVARQHLTSILRTDTNLAAELLKSSLLLTRHLIPNGDILSLSPFVRIWNLREIGADDEMGSSSSVFSLECLEPAALLYATLMKSQMDDEVCVQGMIYDIETLISNHLFSPARSSFFAAQQRNSARSFMIHTLATYLKPLGDSISSSSDASYPRVALLLEVISELFDLAIRNSPNSTPKQRSTEALWLEACLDALSGCAGLPISDDFDSKSTGIEMDGIASPLEDMLRVAKDQKISLSSEFLRSIIARHSGLPDEVPILSNVPRPPAVQRTIRWSLVARILDLDGDIFLVGRGLVPAPTSETSQANFLASLINCVASMRWKASDRTDPNVQDLFYQDRETFVMEILIRLMHTFAHARDLTGFLLLWFTELKKQVEITEVDEDFTAWNSDSLVDAFGELLESSLTPDQVAEMLAQYTQPLMDIVKECKSNVAKLDKNDLESMKFDDLACSAEASAASLVLDAILSGMKRDETLSKAKAHLTALSALLQSLLHYRTVRYRFKSRMWRLLTRTLQLQIKVDESEDFFSQGNVILDSGLLQMAQTTIQDAKGEFCTSFEAFVFVATCSGLFNHTDLGNSLHEHVRNATAAIFVNCRDARLDDGPTSPHLEKLRLYRVLSVLIEVPQTLIAIGNEQRQIVFAELFAAASYLDPAAIVNGTFSDVSLTDLTNTDSELRLEALQESILYLGRPDVLLDWLSTLTSALGAIADNAPRAVDFVIQAQVETLLLKMPPQAIPRADREKFVDLLLQHLHLSEERCMRTMSTISRLMKAANPTSKLCSDAAALWDLANFLDRYSWTDSSNPTLLQVFEEVADTVFKYLGSEIHLERNKQYFESFNNLAYEKFAKKENTPKTFREHFGTLTLLKSRLSNPLPDSLKELNLPRDYLVAMANPLRFDIGQIADISRVASQVSVSPAWSYCVFDAAKLFDERSRPLNHLSANVNPLIRDWTLKLDSSEEAVYIDNEVDIDNRKVEASAYAKGLSSVLSKMEPGEVPEYVAKALAIKDLPVRDQAAIIDAFRAWSLSASLGTTEKLSLVLNMVQSASDIPQQDGYVRLRNELIKTFNYKELETEDSRNKAKSILPRLASRLGDTARIETFGYTLTGINTILSSKPFMVSQFGIEKLLSSIMSISSIGSKDLPRAYGPSIYRRLCQTTNTLIALHRKHLGGRFHVLVPLLQALLTCLFVPHSRVKSLGSKSTPPWLSQQSGVLDAEHAIAYTRILGSLTQPTVSSTASHPRPSINPMLIDETRKARQYAAQFVPYILLHFCSMQLVGKMNTEVRGGLMPGIWACIEAVPREALRGMNSGMGRDEREIWSALWAEWVRTGGKEH